MGSVPGSPAAVLLPAGGDARGLTRAKEEARASPPPAAALPPTGLGRRLMLLLSEPLKEAIISQLEFVNVR